MTDDDIHATITQLVGEEHQLRAAVEHTDEQRSRLQQLEAALDQCWDLLRQRDALRAVGGDPESAKPRPVAEVEGYLQ
jgi:predicted phage gp36 major capsid-like protein